MAHWLRSDKGERIARIRLAILRNDSRVIELDDMLPTDLRAMDEILREYEHARETLPR